MKTRTSIHLFIGLLLLTTALVSCKKTPAAAPFHRAEGFMRFDHASGEFKSQFRFLDSTGKTLALQTVPHLNGSPFAIIQANGTFYELTERSGLSPAYTITLPLGKNDSLSFSDKARAVTAYAFEPKNPKKGAAATFRWDGPALGQDETLILFWEKGPETVQMQTDRPTQENRLTVPAEEMSRLSPGNWNFYAIRKKIKREQVRNAVLECVFEYYTRTDSVTVEP